VMEESRLDIRINWAASVVLVVAVIVVARVVGLKVWAVLGGVS
jgi:hypothetical protein